MSEASSNDPSRRAVFVIGIAIGRVRDLQRVDGDRLIRAALTDAGFAGNRVDLIGAICVDRALQGAHLTGSEVPTFEVVNTALNGPKTLLLARQLIAQGVADCTLAIGIDRCATGATDIANQTTTQAVPSQFDTLAMIRDFDVVRRRSERFNAHHHHHQQIWQRSEHFEANWSTHNRLVACLLASERFVAECIRMQPMRRAVEIVDMRVAFDEGEMSQRTTTADHRRYRMINSLGYDRDRRVHISSDSRSAATTPMEKSGLMHCAIAVNALRDAIGQHSLLGSANGDHPSDALETPDAPSTTTTPGHHHRREVLIAQYAANMSKL